MWKTTGDVPYCHFIVYHVCWLVCVPEDKTQLMVLNVQTKTFSPRVTCLHLQVYPYVKLPSSGETQSVLAGSVLTGAADVHSSIKLIFIVTHLLKRTISLKEPGHFLGNSL